MCIRDRVNIVLLGEVDGERKALGILGIRGDDGREVAIDDHLLGHAEKVLDAELCERLGYELVAAAVEGCVDELKVARDLFDGLIVVDHAHDVRHEAPVAVLAEHRDEAFGDGFVKVLSRKEIIQKSLDNFGYILIAEDMDEAIEAANAIASEHMEIVTANPFEVMMKVRNAGAIFIGENSSEPLGDYFAGPNHVLPTNGTAKFFSALSVDDFVKKSSIVYYSREALRKIHKDIEQFATSEQLTAHANSIAVRFEDEEQ